MRYQELGHSGVSVSVIGLGTWPIGGWAWGGSDDRESIDAIKAALDNGITFIDTAPAYGLGKAEELVGKAIKGRNREAITIATKCGLDWETDEGKRSFQENGTQVLLNLKPESIRRQLEGSLRRMGIEHVDLYITHWQDTPETIAETMEMLKDLQREGKIDAIACSDVSPDFIEAYQRHGGIDAAEIQYNMLDRAVEDEIIPACIDYDISVITHTSLAKGLLSGELDPEKPFPKDDVRARKSRYKPDSIERVNAMLAVFEPIRRKYDIIQAQLSLAWNISQPDVASALVGVRNAEQAKEAAKVGDLRIDMEDIAEMNDVLEEYRQVERIAVHT